MPIEILTEMIKQHEGFRGFVYDDATGRKLIPGMKLIGHPTFGWGFAFDVNPATEGECTLLLASRLSGAINDAKWALGQSYWEALDPERQAALANMAYQMGRTGLIGFHRMLEALRSHDWEKAHTEALASKWASQTPNRAKYIAAVLLTGKRPKGSMSPQAIA